MIKVDATYYVQAHSRRTSKDGTLKNSATLALAPSDDGTGMLFDVLLPIATLARPIPRGTTLTGFTVKPAMVYDDEKNLVVAVPRECMHHGARRDKLFCELVDRGEIAAGNGTSEYAGIMGDLDLE
jgi:hypothetical protein